MLRRVCVCPKKEEEKGAMRGALTCMIRGKGEKGGNSLHLLVERETGREGGQRRKRADQF